MANSLTTANQVIIAQLNQQLSAGLITDPYQLSVVQGLVAQFNAGTLQDSVITAAGSAATPLPSQTVYNTTDTKDNPPSGTINTQNATQSIQSPDKTQSNTNLDSSQTTPIVTPSPNIANTAATADSSGNFQSPSDAQQTSGSGASYSTQTNPQGTGNNVILDKRISLFRTQDKVLWFWWVDNIFGLLPEIVSTGNTNSNSSNSSDPFASGFASAFVGTVYSPSGNQTPPVSTGNNSPNSTTTIIPVDTGSNIPVVDDTGNPNNF